MNNLNPLLRKAFIQSFAEHGFYTFAKKQSNVRQVLVNQIFSDLGGFAVADFQQIGNVDLFVDISGIRHL